MKFFRFFPKLFLFIAFFIFAQLSREFLFRPLITKTIGPFRTEKHLYLDDSFEWQEKAAIISAAMQWEQKTGGAVHFKISLDNRASDYLTLKDSNAVCITKMTLNDKFMQQVEWELNEVLGVNTKQFPCEIIVLNVDRIDDLIEYRSTTMHELGHALGLQHNPQQFSLMYPSADFGSASITQYDLKEFCNIYFCDYKKLK